MQVVEPVPEGLQRRAVEGRAGRCGGIAGKGQREQQRALERRALHRLRRELGRGRRRQRRQGGRAGGEQFGAEGRGEHLAVARGPQRAEGIGQRCLPIRIEAGIEFRQFGDRRAQAPQPDPQLVHMLGIRAAPQQRAGIGQHLSQACRHDGTRKGGGIHRIIDRRRAGPDRIRQDLAPTRQLERPRRIGHAVEPEPIDGSASAAPARTDPPSGRPARVAGAGRPARPASPAPAARRGP